MGQGRRGDDAPQPTAANRRESVSYAGSEMCFYGEKSSCNRGGEEKEKRTHISLWDRMADRKLFTFFFFFGRADDAFAPALPHPVVWNGANSQICHQMWQLYSHMAGPAAALLAFHCVMILQGSKIILFVLFSFLLFFSRACNVRERRREVHQRRRRHRRRGMGI